MRSRRGAYRAALWRFPEPQWRPLRRSMPHTDTYRMGVATHTERSPEAGLNSFLPALHLSHRHRSGLIRLRPTRRECPWESMRAENLMKILLVVQSATTSTSHTSSLPPTLNPSPSGSGWSFRILHRLASAIRQYSPRSKADTIINCCAKRNYEGAGCVDSQFSWEFSFSRVRRYSRKVDPRASI
jgi:hypothetical protein